MTIRVFVGCAANNEDLESQAVLEYSLCGNTNEDVEITWMQLSRADDSPFYCDPPWGWHTTNWATPFTALRWAIPSLCDYEGKAIYLDSDFIIMRDIIELWNQPIRSDHLMIASAGRYDCMLWDCAAARGRIPGLEELMKNLNSHLAMSTYLSRNLELIQPFDGPNWNTMDFGLPDDLTHPSIGAIHYTRMDRQPQLKHAIPRLAKEGGKHWYDGTPRPHDHPPLQRLFDQLLAEAQTVGYGIEHYRREPYGEYSIRGKG